MVALDDDEAAAQGLECEAEVLMTQGAKRRSTAEKARGFKCVEGEDRINEGEDAMLRVQVTRAALLRPLAHQPNLPLLPKEQRRQ